jgi:uncharacterized protein (TIGR02266 family)
MGERALKWVKTLLASRAPAVPAVAERTHSSGVHEVDRGRSASVDTLASLRLVPDPLEPGVAELEGPVSNRRGSARVPCAIELEFAHDSHFFAGLSQDISEGGIFVATYERLPIGTGLSLTFEIQEGSVEVRGEVRWIRDAEQGDHRPGLGIAFTEVSPEAADRIARYCARRPPLYVDV